MDVWIPSPQPELMTFLHPSYIRLFYIRLFYIKVKTRVYTCPLYMQNIVFCNHRDFGNEIILNSWIRLYYISSLSANVQIVYGRSVGNFCRLSWHQYHDMASILKCPSELSRIYGQLKIEIYSGQSRIEFDSRIVLHGWPSVINYKFWGIIRRTCRKNVVKTTWSTHAHTHLAPFLSLNVLLPS